MACLHSLYAKFKIMKPSSVRFFHWGDWNTAIRWGFLVGLLRAIQEFPGNMACQPMIC
jgi:hypothetical protein